MNYLNKKNNFLICFKEILNLIISFDSRFSIKIYLNSIDRTSYQNIRVTSDFELGY